MKDNTPLYIFMILMALFVCLSFFLPNVKKAQSDTITTETVSVKQVSNKIFATGTVESEDQADLHFQTGGKLRWLPIKEGDVVHEGQVIAQLDSYAVQKQLTQALNTYRSAQDTYDQIQDNQSSGVLEGQQRTSLDTTNKNGYSSKPEVDVISDAIKRIMDQNKNTLDNASINVDLANYAVSLSTITAPFDGIVTHEDVSSAGVNILPTTTFSIADPKKMVFRANVSETDVNYINPGKNAIITLNGLNGRELHGTVTKVYPQKITLPSGENVYKVEIQSDELLSNGVLKQTGSVLIDNKYDGPVTLVPAWTILNNEYVWVMDGNTPTLRQVTVGNTIGNEKEIKSGLQENDKVIVQPKTIIKNLYHFL